MLRKPSVLQWGAGLLIVASLFALPRVTRAQSHSASGLVLKVDTARREIFVSMQEIPGYMDAMVMPLTVHRKQDLENLRPGTMVDFNLVVTDKLAYAESIRIRSFINYENDPQEASRLAAWQQVVANEDGSPSALAIGQHVPDFTLTDQNGQQVTLSQFLGRTVAMTFVYTRCPFPNFCFRLSNNFAQLHKRFANRMGQDLILLTITLDPDNDQPNALAQYAAIWKANDPSWRFLTGPAGTVQKVTGMFGVIDTPDMGMMTHSLHTVIIDRRGDLFVNLEGNEFTARQLGDLVETVLNHAPGAPQAETANSSTK